MALAVVSCAKAEQHLKLEEAFAYGVPPTSFIEGVAASGDGQAVVWAPRRAELMYREGSGWRRLTDSLLTSPVGVAPVMGGGTGRLLDVVDGPSGSVLTLNGSGRVTGVRRIVGLAGAMSAVRATGGWFAIVTLPDSTRTLVYVPDGASKALPRYRIPASPFAPAKDVRLSVSGRDALVTDVHSPYTSVIVPANSPEARNLLAPPKLKEFEGRRAPWASLPVLRVSPGYIQVIADARSDRRFMITYGADGRVIRTTTVNAPLALVAAATDSRILVGIRRAGPTELVGYRWSWTD